MKITWKKLPFTLKSLLVMNIAAVLVTGPVLGAQAWNRHQTRMAYKKQRMTSNTRTQSFTTEEMSSFFDISYNLEVGGRFSENDLNWCLNALFPSSMNQSTAAGRRQDVGSVLIEALPQMNAAQKERVFQKMIQVAQLDNPNSEMGLDRCTSATVLGKLGDTRAVSILTLMLGDKRWTVSGAAEQALSEIKEASHK